jgi:hypothetical protein
MGGRHWNNRTCKWRKRKGKALRMGGTKTKERDDVKRKKKNEWKDLKRGRGWQRYFRTSLL